MAHDTIQERKIYSIAVDPEGCKECGYCSEVCPRGVFVQGTDFNAKGYRPVQAVHAEKCVGCQRCFFACPDFSIDIQPKG